MYSTTYAIVSEENGDVLGRFVKGSEKVKFSNFNLEIVRQDDEYELHHNDLPVLKIVKARLSSAKKDIDFINDQKNIDLFLNSAFSHSEGLTLILRPNSNFVI